MSEQNKAIVRRFIEEVWNKGNLSVLDEVYTADYVYRGPGGQEIKGPEGFKQVVAMYRAAFPNLHCTVEDQVAEGDKVATRWSLRGTHEAELMGIAATGNQVVMLGTVIHRFAGGKMAEARDMWDSLSFMQQLGVVLPLG
ncbi:MAG: ester cyclase [Gemmatimonadota bacterium]|nr:MAG: ester cyclase [Gemmatimonadota bacterium]